MRPLVTAGLAVLGVVNLAWGGWAYLAPRHFFDTFPGGGQHWTAAYPPFNPHLVSDLGSTFLTLGVLLIVAAVLGNRTVTTVVLSGLTTFSVLHLAFHARDHGLLTGDAYAASLTTLVLGVLAPLVLLVLARRRGG